VARKFPTLGSTSGSLEGEGERGRGAGEGDGGGDGKLFEDAPWSVNFLSSRDMQSIETEMQRHRERERERERGGGHGFCE